MTDCTISVEAAQLVRAREANYPPIGPGEKVMFILVNIFPILTTFSFSSPLTIIPMIIATISIVTLTTIITSNQDIKTLQVRAVIPLLARDRGSSSLSVIFNSTQVLSLSLFQLGFLSLFSVQISLLNYFLYFTSPLLVTFTKLEQVLN